MNEDHLKTIFKKFSHIDKCRNIRSTGCGIGLWVSKSIANKLNGDILAHSKVGVGTKMTAQINTDTLINQNLSRISSESPCARLSFESRPSVIKKLLIADDDSFNTELLRRFASKMNIDCLWVSNGEELVHKYQERYKEVGMIITDNNMPVMEGVEAAVKINEFMVRNRIKKIPIFLLTADATIIKRNNIDLVGVKKVVPKPMDFSAFSKLVSGNLI
mmetsp:Transcript_69193/g.80688  ORF Transcript_69193/g.80688 Transcript_69193/m.80688 type:complete len:217 (+) Transcript_69193:3-653(+)